MPVFVQWKWIERTKSFLVIFHFYDDFSKPNLRIKKYEKKQLGMISSSEVLEPRKAWITWAASHIELALLSELLSYANIINGLKEAKKRKLRSKLECVKEVRFEGDKEIADVKVPIPKKFVFFVEHGEPVHVVNCFIELCPEYIEYLKKVMKPYLT